MDALEFFRERKRMCNLYEGCDGCPLKFDHCSNSSNLTEKMFSLRRIVLVGTAYLA